MEKITNQVIYEQYLLLKKKKKTSKSEVVSMCNKLFTDISCTESSLYNKVMKVYHKILLFNKNKLTKQKLSFLEQEFTLPQVESNLDRSINASETEKEKQLKCELFSSKKENKSLKRKLDKLEFENETLNTDLDGLMQKYDSVINNMNQVSNAFIDRIHTIKGKENSLKAELKQIKCDFEQKSTELDNLQDQYEKLRIKTRTTDNIRNLNKKLKRREAKIEALGSELRDMKQRESDIHKKESAIEEMKTQLKEKDISYKELNENLRKTQYKISYLKRKFVNQDKHKDDEIEKLEETCMLLQREKNELSQLIELLNDEEILTFENGRYCDDVRETIMELLAMNVSMNKVNDVIRTVVNKLARKSIGRLPANAVKSRLLVEARHLAQLQVAEAMLDSGIDGKVGNCLHGDGTSKYHRHYQNFQITLSSGKTLSLGLKEIGGGDTAAVMKSFMETVDDLSDTLVSNTNVENQGMYVEKLVSSIKSTMSDRGPINPCFNKQLHILREGFLPSVIEQWETFDDSVKKSLSDMCNFFCKMHLLPNMATETNKILKVFEDIALMTKENKFSYKTDESGTARLVRTAAKALHPTGSDEAGVAAYFDSFLKGKNKKLKIVSYRGSRFNILFYDAGATYYHRQHIIDFLKNWPNPNNLLKSVSEDIISPVYQAGLRALGLVDKLITGPYWRVLESSGNILDLNPYLHQMKLSFENWTKNASGLLEGDRLFSDIPVHDDEIYDELLRPAGNEIDDLTIQCLEMVMHSLLLILERQAEEQLPGGKYFDAPQRVKDVAASVPKSNKVSEREFASLDLLLHVKPHATIMTYEALIMWSHNKTLKWLDQKSENEKSELLKSARESYESAASKYKVRQSELKAERMEKLHLKQKEKQKCEIRKQTLKVKATSELVHQGTGVWKTKEEMNIILSSFTDNSEKKNALLTQIRFHKNVLKSKGEPRLFAFSSTQNKKRVQHNLETLIQNLSAIIDLNPVENFTNNDRTDNNVRPSETRKEYFQLEKEKLKSKLLAQREKLKICKEKEKFEKYSKNIDLLVNCRVKHKCVTDTGYEWFDGQVLGIKCKNEQEVKKTEFWVKYDEDDDETKWHFPLLEDLKAGDLIIFD